MKNCVSDEIFPREILPKVNGNPNLKLSEKDEVVQVIFIKINNLAKNID